MTTHSEHHIFGIRHHGPGSARSLRAALETLQPDAILIEGPPDAEPIMSLLVHPHMQPPVALLIYAPDAPHQAVYYPFAVFSPEWQALYYGLTNHIPTRFIDLPQCYQLAEPPTNPQPAPSSRPNDDEINTDMALVIRPNPEEDASPAHTYIATDPLGFLAEAAGYSDGERWWEHMVEQRRDSTGVFAAILEALTAVRTVAPAPDNSAATQREQRREAWMRQSIRGAYKEGFQRIAVVCGAWHAPALIDISNHKHDGTLLKGMAKITVQATWTPWTYGRLAYFSGYGAGIESPGWYHHLFTSAQSGHSALETTIHWITRSAHLLREEGLDISSAHVIEAARLAETLAALRAISLPGLPELCDATRAVFCFDSDLPLRLIAEKLIVGETIGTVPEETPMAPLQQDLAREQKRLRLQPEASWRDLDLDLRKPNERERSHLLHRLTALTVPWGELSYHNSGKGTFHERWRICWQPELVVALIEAGMWGNTIQTAATNRICVEAQQATDLPTLTALVNQALLANLPNAISTLISSLENMAALTSDIVLMIAALPSLANISRYGDVRQTDTSAVAHVIDGMVTRICIGLPGACASLNDEAAAAMFNHIVVFNDVINLLHHDEYNVNWQTTLCQLINQHGLHGLLAGRCACLLLDHHIFAADEVARRMYLALGTANDPAYAAAWLDGILRDSGSLLIYHDTLWQLVDDWVTGLTAETFRHVLPLLRRTFASFHAPERRSLGERARHGKAGLHQKRLSEEIDPERATTVLPLVTRLLGLQ